MLKILDPSLVYKLELEGTYSHSHNRSSKHVFIVANKIIAYREFSLFSSK